MTDAPSSGRAPDPSAEGLRAPELPVIVSTGELVPLSPSFGIGEVESLGVPYAVHEEAVMRTPFATLLRFRKEGVDDHPPVLLVAPLSGHFATLLRGRVCHNALPATHTSSRPRATTRCTDWADSRRRRSA